MLRTILIVGAAVAAVSVAGCSKPADNNTAAVDTNASMSNSMSNAAATATSDTNASMSNATNNP
jgi:hypothetical protein